MGVYFEHYPPTSLERRACETKGYEQPNAQNSTEVRPIELIPAWRTRRGEIDHALSESAIDTQNAQNSTEVSPIALTPAWRTRRGEIDHALSEYAISQPILFLKGT